MMPRYCRNGRLGDVATTEGICQKTTSWLRSQMTHADSSTRGGALGSGAAALMLVGCGGGDDDDDSGDSNGGGATSSVTPQAVLIGGAGKVINGEEESSGRHRLPAVPCPRMSYQVNPITWDPHQTTSIHTHLRTSMFDKPAALFTVSARRRAWRTSRLLQTSRPAGSRLIRRR